MGAGVARAIRKSFPEAYEEDLKTIRGSKDKMGSYSIARIDQNESSLLIINAYTQYHWSGTGVKVNYESVDQVFKSIKKHFSGKRIGYPMIGAGLAGGDWEVISKIIDQNLIDEDHYLVRLPVN